MSVWHLLCCLKSRLENDLTQFPLASRNRNNPEQFLCAPKVYIGTLPAKNALPAYDAPLVLCQPMSGYESASGWAHAEIALRFVVYNDDPEGAENDFFNFLGIVRRSLMQCRKQPLENRFILTLNQSGDYLPWTRPDEQAAQFLEGYCISNWKFQGIE